MGVLKELKELVKDMGGNAANARTASQAIDKIPASGGSGSLVVKPDSMLFPKLPDGTRIDISYDERPIFYSVDESGGNPWRAAVLTVDTETFELMDGCFVDISGAANAVVTIPATNLFYVRQSVMIYPPNVTEGRYYIAAPTEAYYFRYGYSESLDAVIVPDTAVVNYNEDTPAV